MSDPISPSLQRSSQTSDDADAAILNARLRLGLKPDPILTVSEWADQYRMLSSKSSSEPGRWRTSRTPYLKEIMDCLSPSAAVQRVVLMKGAQVGGTEAGNCWLGYIIHQAPGPVLSVSPTVELAKRTSKQRIDPLIEETDVLRVLVKDRRSRDSGNTVLTKEFAGGVLVMTGANSAVGLRSMPARYLFLDEVDGYPGDVAGEGDPITLAYRRSATFQRRKMFLVSTPKIKGLSRIEREFSASDQRYFFVPCPHCGEMQVLEFDRLRWPDGKPLDAVYICAHCEAEIDEQHKTIMLAAGEWRATDPGPDKAAGFHLSSLYSPVGWYSWGDCAVAGEEAKQSPDLRKVFWNTVLGLPYEEEAEAPDWERVYERRENYPIGMVPWGGLFLSAGADVQGNRIELEVVAWGRGKQSWSVEYFVLDGDTSRPEVWKLLEEVLGREWLHASGQSMPIRVLCIDSGAYTQNVYDWVKDFPQASWGPAGAVARHTRTVVAVKGQSRDTALLLGTGRADAGGKRRGLKVWSVGGPVAKSELYRWLKLSRPTDEALAEGGEFPPGYCHFPQYGEDFFKQLTSERLVTRIVKGYPKAVWLRDVNQRNEALDCRVYARAAAAIYGVDRFDDRLWTRLEEPLGVNPNINPSVKSAEADMKPSRQKKPEAGSRAEAQRVRRDQSEDGFGRRDGGDWI